MNEARRLSPTPEISTGKLELPLYVLLPRVKSDDKQFSLNLNVYRNAHFQVLNQAKVIFADQVKMMLLTTDPKGGLEPPFHFTYTVYPPNKREFDLANVLPIVQKFCDDALISAGVIEDDNYSVVSAIDYRFGGIDRKNPRVELEINEYRASG